MKERKWKPWKTSELRIVREKANECSVSEIAKLLGRTSPAVYKKLQDLGLSERLEQKKRWSEEDDFRLLEGIENFVDWDRVSRHVGRTVNACMIRACKRKLVGSFRFWTPERREELQRLLEDGLSYAQIARHFGKNYQAMYRFIGRLNDNKRHEC